MTKKVNFKEITLAYDKYLKSFNEQRKVKELILNDEEIQNLYNSDQVRDARMLIDNKYKNYTKLNIELAKDTNNLVDVMINSTDEFKGFDIDKINYIVALQDKLFKLAEKIYNDYKNIYIAI